jgi:hypothetical protein
MAKGKDRRRGRTYVRIIYDNLFLDILSNPRFRIERSLQVMDQGDPDRISGWRRSSK